MALKIQQPQNILNGVGSSDATKKTASKITGNESPSFLNKAEEVAGSGANLALGAIGWGTQIAGIIASIGGGINKLGKWTGLKFLENSGNSFKVAINNFTGRTFGDVFNIGDSKSVRGIQKYADRAGDAVNTVTDRFGVSYIAKARDARTKNLLDDLAKLGKEASGRNVPNGLADHAKNLINSVGNTDHAEISETFSKAIKASNLSKEDGKVFKKILYTAEKANKSQLNAGYWRNPGNLLKNLVGSIKNAKVLPGLANVTFIGLSIASIFNVGNNLRKNFSELKVMSKDITGKETSTWDILSGKVPAPVKEARSKLIKNSIVSGATDTVSLGLNVASAVKGNVSMLGFFAPQIVGMGLTTLIGESTLPTYTELSQKHASGQKISAEDYAGLIGKLSPEIQARGGSDSVFAKELGKIYSEERATPAQVVRRVANGEFKKDLNSLITANEAAKVASASTGSHVAALQKPAAKAISPENKPVIGNHTAQLVASAMEANHSLSGV